VSESDPESTDVSQVLTCLHSFFYKNIIWTVSMFWYMLFNR
jgi:magnesium-transporting ATPase (P-type)